MLNKYNRFNQVPIKFGTEEINDPEFTPKTTKDKDGKEIKDTGFVKKFTKVVHKNQTELFENDDNVIGVAEEIAMQSHVNEMFDYRPQADEFASDGSLESVNASLKQWYADNEDYVTGIA